MFMTPTHWCPCTHVVAEGSRRFDAGALRTRLHVPYRPRSPYVYSRCSGRFEEVRCSQTTPHYIARRTRCVGYWYSSSEWFDYIEPPRTFLNNLSAVFSTTHCVFSALKLFRKVRGGLHTGHNTQHTHTHTTPTPTHTPPPPPNHPPNHPPTHTHTHTHTQTHKHCSWTPSWYYSTA